MVIRCESTRTLKHDTHGQHVFHGVPPLMFVWHLFFIIIKLGLSCSELFDFHVKVIIIFEGFLPSLLISRGNINFFENSSDCLGYCPFFAPYNIFFEKQTFLAMISFDVNIEA